MRHKYWQIALSLLMAMMMMSLSGCGLLAGKSDYVPFSQAYQSHETAGATRISAQSKFIYSSLKEAHPETPSEKVLLAVIAMMQIARLAPTPFTLIKPTSGYDVLDHNLAPIVGSTLTGFVSWKAFDALKALSLVPGNIFNLGKGDINTDHSFNPTTLEQHQTYSTNSNLTSTAPRRSPTATPTVPEPATPANHVAP